MDLKIVSVFLFSQLITSSLALKCYTCSTTEDDQDQSCATDVVSKGNSAITDCDKKYCTIVRIEYLDPPGKLQSFNRNCIDKLIQKDGRYDDTTHRSYYRSCKDALCNSGNGRAESTSATQYLGDKSTIYVPGIKSGAFERFASVFVIFVALIFVKLI